MPQYKSTETTGDFDAHMAEIARKGWRLITVTTKNTQVFYFFWEKD
jgi:hypothetical protein